MHSTNHDEPLSVTTFPVQRQEGKKNAKKKRTKTKITAAADEHVVRVPIGAVSGW